jgi:hypothetical protein
MRQCGNHNVFVTGSSLYDVLYWESVLERVFKRVKREGGGGGEIHKLITVSALRYVGAEPLQKGPAISGRLRAIFGLAFH